VRTPRQKSEAARLQPHLYAPPDRRADTPRAEALSFFGFVVEPFEGSFAERFEGGVETLALGGGRFAVTLRASVQSVKDGDVGTIDHRYLVDKRHREALEAKLERFCRSHGIVYRAPHWRLACRIVP
jgi:hypothetical protein